MRIIEKKIATSVTVGDRPQVIALAIAVISRIGVYEREQVLRTILAYFDFMLVKRET